MLAAALFVPAAGVAAPPQSVTVEQLNGALAEGSGRTDAEVAQELGRLKLSERVSGPRLTQWMAALPGERSRAALTILADSAEWLEPEKGAIATNPVPDAAMLRDMLVSVVQYADTALRKLPNFIATRETESFEDRPEEDLLESTGTVSLSEQPLHPTGRAAVEVTFRDGHEEQRAQEEAKRGEGVHGLTTAGEFGPFLSTVLSDALKGKITWARWEQGDNGVEGVFRYQVPRNQSHYEVEFCCTNEEVDGVMAIPRFYRQIAGYHGEIAFDPATGVVRRVAIVAEQGRGELVASAAMMVEYGPVVISGKTVTVPTRSVSLLGAHTSPSLHGMQMSSEKMGPVKTYLNDTKFENYHQFRGDVRMVDDGVSGP